MAVHRFWFMRIKKWWFMSDLVVGHCKSARRAFYKNISFLKCVKWDYPCNVMPPDRDSRANIYANRKVSKTNISKSIADISDAPTTYFMINKAKWKLEIIELATDENSLEWIEIFCEQSSNTSRILSNTAVFWYSI